jgi:hypothetical protein
MPGPFGKATAITMCMKTAAGPELLGSSHPQSAGLSRAWITTQRTGASLESSAVSSAVAPASLTSFRSFLDTAGSLRAQSASDESELQEVDSALQPSVMAPDHPAKSGESSATRKHSGRGEESKSGSSKQSVAAPTAYNAMTSVGETPVILFLPNSPTQRIQPETQTRLQTALGIPSAAPGDLHPSAGPTGQAAQTVPPSAAQMGQSVKLATKPTLSTARVSFQMPSPAESAPRGEASDVRSLSPNEDISAKGSRVHPQEDTQPTGGGATYDPATGVVKSAATSQEMSLQLQAAAAVPSIEASIESRLVQPSTRVQPSLQANQTHAIEPRISKSSRQNEFEPTKPQTAVAAPTNNMPADSPSLAHENLSRPGAASGPTGVGHFTKEIPSAPPVANGSPGASSPDGTTMLARSSMNKAVAGEPLAILDNSSQPLPTPAWTHAGTAKVEAGFQDPSLGWIGVRATTDSSGVHAAVLPSSSDASRMLGGSMADLGAYLTEQHHSVESLTLAPPSSAEAGNTGGSYDGAALAQGSSQERGGYGQQSGTNPETAPEIVMDRESMSSVSGETLNAAASSTIYSASGGALISVFA